MMQSVRYIQWLQQTGKPGAGATPSHRGDTGPPREPARNRLVRWFLIGMLLGAQPTTSLGNASASGFPIGALKLALRSQVQWEALWGSGLSYEAGAKARLELATDGRRFVAILDPVSRLPTGERVVGTFVGTNSSGRIWFKFPTGLTFVSRGDRSPTTRSTWGAVWETWENVTVTHTVLTLPKKTPSPLESKDPIVTRMRQLVLSTLKAKLLDDATYTKQGLPPEVTVIVAPLSAHDPWTWAFVQELGRLFEVPLYDPEARDDPRLPLMRLVQEEPHPYVKKWVLRRLEKLGKRYEVRLR